MYAYSSSKNSRCLSVSTLVNFATKLTVKSSFFKDSHPENITSFSCLASRAHYELDSMIHYISSINIQTQAGVTTWPKNAGKYRLNT